MNLTISGDSFDKLNCFPGVVKRHVPHHGRYSREAIRYQGLLLLPVEANVFSLVMRSDSGITISSALVRMQQHGVLHYIRLDSIRINKTTLTYPTAFRRLATFIILGLHQFLL